MFYMSAQRTKSKKTPNSFREAVQQGLARSPTQMGFSESAWTEAYHRHKTCDSDKDLWAAGVFFSQTLSPLRAKIQELETNSPALRSLPATRAYVAWANAQLIAHATRQLDRIQNSIDSRFVSETLDPRVTPEWAPATGGFSFSSAAVMETATEAIRFPLDRIQADNHTGIGEHQGGALMAIVTGANLYHIYERAWLACLWNGYSVHTHSDSCLICPASRHEALIEVIAAHRRDAIAAEATLRASFAWRTLPADEKRTYFIGASVGDKGQLGTRVVAPDTPEIPPKSYIRTSIWGNLFWDAILEHAPPSLQGGTIKDCARVWYALSLIADEISERMKPDLQSESVRGFTAHYSTTLRRSKIRRFILHLFSAFPSAAIDPILSLLTFRGRRDDPWERPIIDCGNGSVTLLIAPLLASCPQRRMESFMSAARMDESIKGKLFEREALQSIRGSMARCSSGLRLEAVHLRKTNEQEEVDILIIIGSTAIVCECKCLRFPVEPMERHKHSEILNAAAEQAIRKCGYVQKNLASVGKCANLDLSSISRVIPLVIVSNCYHAGFEAAGVPVADLHIILRYFDGFMQTGQFNLQSGTMEPGAKNVRFYQNEAEMAEHVDNYLRDPPQVRLYREAKSEWKFGPLPKVQQDGPRVLLAHLDLENIGGLRTD